VILARELSNAEEGAACVSPRPSPRNERGLIFAAMARALKRICRQQLVVAVGVMTAGLVSCVAAAASSGGPVLGWQRAFQNGAGFGQAQPRHVYLGGDPTGEVKGLRWHRWGAGTTTGFGMGWCPGRSVADGHFCSVSLHASDLGRYHGHRAYRTLSFYFKPGPHQRWTFGSRWDVCSGQALA
jgi:hypothetical protein